MNPELALSPGGFPRVFFNRSVVDWEGEDCFFFAPEGRKKVSISSYFETDHVFYLEYELLCTGPGV